MKLTITEKVALRDVAGWPAGYALHWRPAICAKLEHKGMIETRDGWRFITDAGRSALSAGRE